MKSMSCLTVLSVALFCGLTTQNATAAIALDRSRAVFEGTRSSMSLNISNQNKALPYLAQAWIENDTGNKINVPLIALPPLQRVEPLAKGQIKLQMVGNVDSLPADRESLFYFNVREIPPKSTKANTLQIALQTRIKLFYRPKSLISVADGAWQEKLALYREGEKYRVSNPSPYYITLAGGYEHIDGPLVPGFEPVMIAPRSEALLSVTPASLGKHPVLSYINDYGGRPRLLFSCTSGICRVTGRRAG